MKLGLLLPSSRIYPSMTLDFTNGLRCALATNESSEKIDFSFESIGNGTDKDVIVNALHKLVLQEGVHVVLLFVNPKILQDVLPVIQSLQRPVIITNIGGNLPLVMDNSEFIFYNSLNLWESSFKAAEYGVENFGKKAAFGSYFYDAGYQLYESFLTGLVKSGGNIIFNQVSEFNPDPDDFDKLMSAFDQEPPDFLFALYSERDAVDFLNKLIRSDANGRYPIVTAGMMIDDEILAKVDGYPENIYRVSTWDKVDPNQENQLFLEEYKKTAGGDANYFSLLGYECGGIICESMKKADWSANGRDQYLAMKSSSFSSPRGLLSFEGEQNIASYGHKLYALKENGEREFLDDLGILDHREEYVSQSSKRDTIAGWMQPYLCP